MVTRASRPRASKGSATGRGGYSRPTGSCPGSRRVSRPPSRSFGLRGFTEGGTWPVLTKRLARYAASRGIELPSWEDSRIGEGLAGVLRVTTELLVWVRPDVEARLGPASQLVILLNAGLPSVTVQPGDGGPRAVEEFAHGAPRPPGCALELFQGGWTYKLLPGSDGFQLV